MELIKTQIPEVVILKPRVFDDARGYFFESYSQRDLNQLMQRDIQFVQDNESRSSRGVMRGLHFQRPPFTQAKLVRCVEGAVLDVAVDNHLQFFVPRGFAHGFAVLSETALFQYKCDNYYAPQADGGISLLDPALGIDWRIDPSTAILSEKDTRHPLLEDFESPFIYGEF